MTTQIIGTSKCRLTRKCRLWFDERAVPYQFIDLIKRNLSPGELDAIAGKCGWDPLIDCESRVWKDRQLQWKEYDPREELLEHPLLLRTPVVRSDRFTSVGWQTELWEMLRKGS